MSATMRARFPGKCAACGERFPAGTEIRGSRRAWRHVQCGAPSVRYVGDDDGDELYAEHVRLYAEHVRACGPDVHVVTFQSGEHHFQNARGRCEDAPCCGCCT